MPALLRRAAVLALAIIVFFGQTVGAAAALTPAEQAIKELLEKSLSVVEIDKEIARVQTKQTQLEASLSDTSARISQQEQSAAKQREQAGKVLRSYYMGERDWLLAALFSFHSLQQWFMLLDYMDLILSRDREVLERYAEQTLALRKQYDRQAEEKDKLAETEAVLRKQRERVEKLQQEMDITLEGRSDADKLRLMMEEMNQYWNNVGLSEVRTYFKALSDAMQHLPDWVQDHKEMLEIDGFEYTLRIPEQALNDFLREQNELFNKFAFQFKDGQVIASGERDGISVEVAGSYTIETEPSSIQFHVQSLTFNDLALPDTTRQDLEKQFDLNFYPQKIVSFLTAKSVSIENGELILILKVKL
ncbi:conserved hypothetical protein [Paenibacillus curdlanolyticus YK9]|uniref:Membrane-bound metallopeptidase n=1 Tax=Paenibacillus curdlanolyticus YK9 TaxID=717606 RepID=E0I3D8_9BACL|nr:hypothetical protein [Paenibacillus curdlanolyticus]EFM12802.1 conserved hypothetical protein [Paenibacillus curdlanolyticus YK9]